MKSRQKSGYAEYQTLIGEHLALLERFLNVYLLLLVDDRLTLALQLLVFHHNDDGACWLIVI